MQEKRIIDVPSNVVPMTPKQGDGAPLEALKQLGLTPEQIALVMSCLMTNAGHGSQEMTKPYIIQKKDGGCYIDKDLLREYIIHQYDLKFYNNFKILENGYYKDIDLKELIINDMPTSKRSAKITDEVMVELRYDNRLKINERDLANYGDPRYIPFSNGIYDINTKSLLNYEENKHLIFVNQIPRAYNPDAERCEVFEKFMYNLCRDDFELRRLLLQIIGVAISDIRGFKKMFWFYNDKADSGKSTFLNVLQVLLTSPAGEKSYSGVSLSQLVSAESFDTHHIIGKKVNIDSDVDTSFVIKSDGQLKKLSGGTEEISFSIKNKEAISTKINALLLFACNGVPKMWLNTKQALASRFMLIRFANVVAKEDQIKNLENKINYEYVIKLALEELHSFIDDNYTFIEPKVVTLARKEMIEESDDVIKFISHVISYDETSGKDYSTSAIYHRFKYWFEIIEGNDTRPPAPKTFTARMKETFGEKIYGMRGPKEKRVRSFCNLKLNEEFEREFNDKQIPF